MSKSLDDALNQGPWSVSAVIFDLDDMLDDEGRPISERRADAAVRVGVEMEMRECPFNDIRKNKLMNVSALSQITHYFNDVSAELAAYRRQSKKEHATWEEILECIVELLAGPATYLLQHRSPVGPVPAKTAVGHKLAAGMFGVLRELHQRLALGTNIPVTVDSFLDLIEEMGALLGTSEACAGSPKMIRKVSTVLLEGSTDFDTELDPKRFEIARCLALQVQLGIFWNLYDRVHLWPLLRGEFREHLTPGNMFLEGKFERTGKTLGEQSPQRPNSTMLPDKLDQQLRQPLADALNDRADPASLEDDMQAAIELLNEPGAAISYNGEHVTLARCVANYLNTYRLFEAELSRIELELRELLEFSPETEIRLGAAVFPTPQALSWYELILGRKLGSDGHLTGKDIRAAALPA